VYPILFLIFIPFSPIGILESGWKDDRQIEHISAQKDLEYIDDLTVLLQHTEKRKAKVGTIVHRLIGELQQLKYYLEGMSNPPTPALPIASPGLQNSPIFSSLNSSFLDQSSRPISSRRRSISDERSHSAVLSPLDPLKTRRRPLSAIRADVSAPTPTQLNDDVQQRVTVFVEDNFNIKSGTRRKTSKNTKPSRSTGQHSAQTDFSSWKSIITSAPSPFDENDRRKTTTNPRVAFA
jgi:hypothetical protein